MSKKRSFAPGMSGDQEKEKRVPKTELPKDSAELFRLLKAHQYPEAAKLVLQVQDINLIDPETGLTALHWAAGHVVKSLLEVLWKRPDLDELARDAQGRYASELAWQVAEDEMLGAELMWREKAYGERVGQRPWPKSFD